MLRMEKKWETTVLGFLIYEFWAWVLVAPCYLVLRVQDLFVGPVVYPYSKLSV